MFIPIRNKHDRDLFNYCKKYWGKWYCTRYYQNKGFLNIYDHLKKTNLSTVLKIVSSGSKDWLKFFSFDQRRYIIMGQQEDSVVKTIKKTNWLDLKKICFPNLGTEYVYSHESRCDGKIIAIIPFRIISHQLNVLLRDEVTPCWGPLNTTFLSSITGGIEPNMSIKELVIKELKEEAGYLVKETDLIPLGTCKGTKSTDTTYYLYAVNLKNNSKNKNAIGDGTYFESLAECVWTDDISPAADPLVYTLYYKLKKYLKENKKLFQEN